MKSSITHPHAAGHDRVDLNDLGFGSRLTGQTGQRLLNRDGTFNVKREGFSILRSSSLYHSALSISWTRFNLIVGCSALLLNTLFAFAYILCGRGALIGASGVTFADRFLDAFFFSVQTSTTIGYGHIVPSGTLANVVVSVEVMAALLGFALATSIMFARFSRPNAKIIFSEKAVIAPYQGMMAFEFRMMNARSNQLIQLEVQVLLSRMETHEGRRVRRFHKLKLERDQVAFFPLNWTVVHPIDSTSLLHGVTEAEFLSWDPEIMILLTAIDETFSQAVHARCSYKGDEVVWGARFSDMYRRGEDGMISVDVKRLHVIEQFARS
jgi:inward rectifier potassium channel